MNTIAKLCVGDVSLNGQVTILDEDRLSYAVLNNSKGALGVRTISKSLLNEFIDYLIKYPDRTPTEARIELCGKTGIDKFEYGYASTLCTMAKMAISKSKNLSQLAIKEENKHICPNDLAYISAIKTKPFIILGGFSGTGKSQKVKELAFATCPDNSHLTRSETTPGNYLLVSVKPNWHDATDIIGFRSSIHQNYYVTDFMRFLVKAMHFPSVPFFVCLDEMNLAPVEEYFADFLSVIESRKKSENGNIVTDAIIPASVFNEEYNENFNIFESLGFERMDSELHETIVGQFIRTDLVNRLKRDGLTIPSNVIIIGTVNMDDTTNSFSRKVIDRAMTFETVVGKFDEDYFKSDVALHYVKNPLKGELFLSDEVRATQMIEEGRFILTADEQNKILSFINNINEDLEGSPFKISYRILNETILLYRSKKRIAEIMSADGGFEDGVEFKTDLNTIFDDILMQKILPRIEGDYEKCSKCLNKLSARAEDNEWLKSYEKIEFMIRRFGTDKSGFTSFWN